MKTLLCLLLISGSALAQDQTFLVTGTITQNMWGVPETGMLQFQYTINPLINPEQDPSQRGPVTSVAFSVNGGAFQPDNGWGTVDIASGGFTLYPGSGAMISYDARQGTMLVYDYSLNGEFANVTSVQQVSASLPSQAPEIDSKGWASGLTLLIGGLLVLRGRRSASDEPAQASPPPLVKGLGERFDSAAGSTIDGESEHG